MKKIKRFVSIAIVFTVCLMGCLTPISDWIDIVKIADAAASGTQKLLQSIEGPTVYNLLWERSVGTGYLKCHAKSKVTYKVLEGADYLELDGAKITMKKRGQAFVLATAAETSVYKGASTVLAISCEKEPFIDDVGELVYQWSGEGQGYKYKSSVGIESCRYEYAIRDNKVPVWSEEKPFARGNYFVKLYITTLGGNQVIRFSTMVIKKKQLTIKGLKVKTKVYDGTTRAELTGSLSGVVGTDDVTLTMPKIRFASANAGDSVAIKMVNGKFSISGTGIANYDLKPYSVSGLRGKILPLDGVITVNDQFGTQGEKPKTLTFSCYPSDVDVKGVKLKCKVKKNTTPGTYKITASGAKAKNYKFSYVPGTYTVYPSDNEPVPDTGTMDDRTTEPMPTPDYIDPDTTPTTSATTDSTAQETPIPMDKPKLAVYAASSSVKFSGIVDTVKVDGEKIMINQVFTNTGNVSSTDTGFEIKYKKSGWTTELNVLEQNNADLQQLRLSEGQNGECGVINNLEIEVRNKLTPELKTTVFVGQYVIDKEMPCISIQGAEVLFERMDDVSLTSSNAVELGVSALFGLTGEKSLTYRLVTDADEVVAESPGWKDLNNGKVTIAQNFEGQVAVRAVDALGNYSIVYSEKIKVDAMPPQINGVKSGEIYSGSVKFMVEDDSGIESVLVDGRASDAKGIITGKGMHEIKAVDNNGNQSSITFTIKSQGFIKDIILWVKSLFG